MMATIQHATMEELLEVVFSVVCAMIVTTEWHGKHASTTIEELCFLHGPCQGVILKTVQATQ
jgi:hypothetical protein